MARRLLDFNVQREGRYAQSVAVDRVITEARGKVATFVGGDDPDEVAFGMNATSFLRLVSLAIGQTITAPRDEIPVADMDHHANISTWLESAKTGARIVWWKMRDDQRLRLPGLFRLRGLRSAHGLSVG